MKVGKVIGKCILLIVVGAAAGIILLTLAYMLPVNIENRDNVYAMLEAEGWYPRASVSVQAFTEYLWTDLTDILDNNTDKIMLYTAMDTEEGNPLIKAMRAHNGYVGDYSYYWHGYVSILRPLLLFFDYSDIRTINGACQFLIIMLLAYMIGREKGVRYVVVLAISYVLLGSLALPLSLQYTWVFYIASIGTYMLLRHRNFFSDRYLYFFIVIGMVTSFLDLLTYPLFTWGMPLLWWLAMDESQRKAADWVKRVIVSGLGWILGYALMWLMKWILATLILGRNVMEEAIAEVFLRSGMEEGLEYSFLNRLRPVWNNWHRYESTVFFLILGGVLAWWFLQTVKSGWHKNEKRHALFLAGTSSAVWCMALANHVTDHSFFTFRIFGVSLLAFFMLMLESISIVKSGEGRVRRKQEKIIAGGLLVLAVIAAFILTSLTREEVTAHNGYTHFRQIEMNPNGMLEVSFTPTLNGIKTFYFGLECAGTGGFYEFTIWDGDKPKERELFQIADAEDEYFHTLDVSWHLKKNQEYLLTIEIRDADAPVYAWVSQPEETPLIEYGKLEVDGVEVGGQLLTGISYWNPPASKKTFLFVAMTFLYLIMVGVYVFCPPIKFKHKTK